MPWRCPACSNIIQHNEAEQTPRPFTRYRCHVCRIGLEYQPTVNKMVVVRTDDDGETSQRKRTPSR